MKRILDPEPEPAAADREGEDGEEGNLSADDAPADRAPTFRRGARASYYRKVAKVERVTMAIANHVPDDSGGEDAGGSPSLVPPVPRIPPALPTIRSAHEQLWIALDGRDELIEAVLQDRPSQRQTPVLKSRRRCRSIRDDLSSATRRARRSSCL